MIVGEVRKVLEGLDPNMLVGVVGHFGEYNEFDSLPTVEKGGKCGGKREPPWLGFPSVDVGLEPE